MFEYMNTAVDTVHVFELYDLLVCNAKYFGESMCFVVVI